MLTLYTGLICGDRVFFHRMQASIIITLCVFFRHEDVQVVLRTVCPFHTMYCIFTRRFEASTQKARQRYPYPVLAYQAEGPVTVFGPNVKRPLALVVRFLVNFIQPESTLQGVDRLIDYLYHLLL